MDKRCPKCGHYNPDWAKECEMCGAAMKMLMTRRKFLIALGAIGAAAVTVAAGIKPPAIEVPKAEVLVPANPNMTIEELHKISDEMSASKWWIAHYVPDDFQVLSSDSALPEGFFDDTLFHRAGTQVSVEYATMIHKLFNGEKE